MQNKNGSKTILITGATSGIGKEAAIALAKLGQTVIFTARTKTAGESAKREIISKSGNNRVEYFECDLASIESIRKFSDEFKRNHSRLDVLVNNAGVMPLEREVSKDDIELNFAVNYLAQFLLTNLLLDILKKSAPSRIINVSSSAHAEGTIDFDDLNSQRFDRYKAYSQSKLAVILFTKKLANMLKGYGITVNCFHPGVVRTKLAINALSKSNVFVRLLFPLTMITPRKAAKALVYLATSPEVENATGEYFDGRKNIPPAKAASNIDTANKLWTKSEEMINDVG